MGPIPTPGPSNANGYVYGTSSQFGLFMASSSDNDYIGQIRKYSGGFHSSSYYGFDNNGDGTDDIGAIASLADGKKGTALL